MHAKLWQCSQITLFNDPVGVWFRGMGAMYLNVSDLKREDSPLSDSISLAHSDSTCHATWSSMPVYCRYCHKDDHNRLELPIRSQTVRRCWNCGDPSHI
jgi:hypothetical protein